MTIKTGILAAAAALTLAVPAIASAQPYWGGGDYGRYERREDFRRYEREREWRRAQEMRRLEWQRRHDYGYRYAPYGYYGR